MKGQHWDPCILFPPLCAGVIHGNLRHLVPSKGFCGEAIHILAGLYTTALLQTRKYPLEFTYQFRCKQVFTSKVIKTETFYPQNRLMTLQSGSDLAGRGPHLSFGGSQWSWRKFMAQHKHAKKLSPSAATGTRNLYHQQSPLSTHRPPLVTSCSCQAPLLCRFCLQHPFRVVRCPTEGMTFIPSSSLGYGNGSSVHSCVQSWVSLPLLWFGVTQYLHFNCNQLVHNCVSHKHYSTTVAHKKGLQPSRAFWEGQVFQGFVWGWSAGFCFPARRFNC